MRALNETRPERGFSLIEIVVALALVSLVAGALAPLVVRQAEAKRRAVTIDKLERLSRGLAGETEYDTFGFLGDMGALPATLDELVNLGAQPAYLIDINGIGAGWNGPYVSGPSPGSDPTLDGWGTAFQYDPLAGQVTSAGPDRTFASADDLVFPGAALVTTGNLSVPVTGVPNDAGAPCALGSTEVAAFVSLSNTGTRAEVPMGGVGPFTLAALHNGAHAVRIQGLGAWAGAGATDVVVVRGGGAVKGLTLIQPAGAPPGCGP